MRIDRMQIGCTFKTSVVEQTFSHLLPNLVQSFILCLKLYEDEVLSPRRYQNFEVCLLSHLLN